MRKILVLMIIVLGIFVSGCPTGVVPVEPVDIYQGTGGLSIDIIEGLPPDEIYVGTKESPSPFQVGVEIKNDGATDISKGILSISYDDKIFDYKGILPWQEFNLRAKTTTNPEGEISIKNFNMEKNENLPVGKETTVVVTGCYQYNTTASAEVCIAPYIYETFKVLEQGCDFRQYSNIVLGGGHGGPVAVTKISESIRPRSDQSFEIVFKIDIENLGDGEIRSKDGYFKECRGQLGLNKTDLTTAVIEDISFSAYSLKNGRISCIPDKLRVGQKTITCTAIMDKNSIESAYPTPLTIKLGYGYVTRKYAKLKILERSEVK